MWTTGNSESILFFLKRKKEYKPKKLLVVILTIVLLEQFIKLLTPVTMKRNLCHMGSLKKKNTHTHARQVMIMSNNTDSLCMLLYIYRMEIRARRPLRGCQHWIFFAFFDDMFVDFPIQAFVGHLCRMKTWNCPHIRV